MTTNRCQKIHITSTGKKWCTVLFCMRSAYYYYYLRNIPNNYDNNNMIFVSRPHCRPTAFKCRVLLQTALDITLKNKANIARNPPPNGYDNLILRFRGYWDDRNQMEGELHFYEVLYYLVDDTMELVEEIIDDTKVSGIRHKMIVRRQRLPKVSIKV